MPKQEDDQNVQKPKPVPIEVYDPEEKKKLEIDPETVNLRLNILDPRKLKRHR
jgi:hypothetical protein